MEYDSVRDLLYLWFGTPGTKSAETKTIKPGVYADFDKEGKLLGIEVLDASTVFQHRVQFEFSLIPSTSQVSEKGVSP